MSTKKKKTEKSTKIDVTQDIIDVVEGLIDRVIALEVEAGTYPETVAEQQENLDTCNKNVQWACDKIEQIELKLNQVAGRMGL